MLRSIRLLTLALFIAFSASPAMAFTLKQQFAKGAFEYQGTKVNPKPLEGIYKANKYKGLWTSKKGLFGLKRGLTKEGKLLIKTLSAAENDGLNPVKYLPRKNISKDDLKGKQIDKLELYLTANFLKFARDVHVGIVDQSRLQADIYKTKKSFDPIATMKLVKKKGLKRTLASLRPQHPQYEALRNVMAKTSDPSKRALIAANMERWRWLPNELGEKHILVNQPAYEVYIYNKNRIVDQRRVIIGKTEHASPQFSDRMTYVEFNPQWNVPQSIAVNEYLPKLLKNPNYLKKRGYTLFENWNQGAKELDGRKVKWSKIDPDNPKKFPYRIVQGEGPRNALGQVKFLFPNDHAIYLHDTPTKKLFNSKDRAFSHGCIRIHNPLDFARKIFELDGAIAPGKIDGVVNKGDRKSVILKKPMPIHLAYFTAWVGNGGKLQTYKDVYSRDPVILAAIGS
jgi:murein L,D-transpeptidase YcbB/YkuD